MKTFDTEPFDSVELPQQLAERIELLQLTDTHILAGAGQCFDGVDTAATLRQVLAHARLSHWPPDAVLVTGDLVHDPGVAAYDRLQAILKTLGVPVFCIPGNHDEPSLMHQLLAATNISTAKSILFERWLIMMLDSFLPGTHAGCLSEFELGYLDRSLSDHQDKFALICLHHPPVSIGSSWMDRMGLQNPAKFFDVVDRHPQVRAVLWGHIHQEFNCERNGVKLLATPSTCLQFVPAADGYYKADKPPAYRSLQLHDSGKIWTEVVEVQLPTTTDAV